MWHVVAYCENDSLKLFSTSNREEARRLAKQLRKEADQTGYIKNLYEENLQNFSHTMFPRILLPETDPIAMDLQEYLSEVNKIHYLVIDRAHKVHKNLEEIKAKALNETLRVWNISSLTPHKTLNELFKLGTPDEWKHNLDQTSIEIENDE